MIEAELHDGTILEFPDGTDQDVIQRVVKSILTPQEPAPQPVQTPEQRAQQLAEIPGIEGETPSVQSPQQPEDTLLQKAGGILEAGATLGTGAVLGAPAHIIGTLDQLAKEILSGDYGSQESARRVQEAAQQMAGFVTYEPKTQTGQQIVETIGKAGEALTPLTPLAGEIGAVTRPTAAITQKAMQAASSGDMNTLSQMVNEYAPILKELKDNRIERESIGAAKMPIAESRVSTAENLPVPLKLTTGEAMRDPAQLSFEKEMAKSPQFGKPLRDRIEENNLNALYNFDALIDLTEAELPSDISQTGNAVVKALSQGYKNAKTETRVAYKNARNSEESKAIVDTSTAVKVGTDEDAITSTVWDYLNSKPKGVDSSKVTDSARATAIKLGLASEDEAGNIIPRDGITVGEIEDFRRELSGMAKFDDKTGIRDETILKNIIDQQTENVGGDLYKKARALRVKQARKYENRAIIARLVNNVKGMDDPKVPADKVFQRSVLNSSPEEITFLKRVLNTSGEDGAQAWKELQGATVRYIRDRSITGSKDSAGNDVLSPSALRRTINDLDKNGRLDILLGKKSADITRDLSEVLDYVTTTPPGTLINNSGTAGVIMAAMAEAGGYGAAFGVPIPIISGLKFLKDHVKDIKTKKRIESALKGLEAKKQ